MDKERLIYIREELEKTQREMANILDISKATYASWETKRTIIPINYLIELCNLSKYSIDFVSGLSNDKKRIDKPYKLDYIIIGNNVRKLRMDYNISQREFAKSLNTTQKNIYLIENAKAKRITILLYEIAKKYKITISNLLK